MLTGYSSGRGTSGYLAGSHKKEGVYVHLQHFSDDDRAVAVARAFDGVNAPWMGNTRLATELRSVRVAHPGLNNHPCLGREPELKLLDVVVGGVELLLLVVCYLE